MNKQKLSSQYERQANTSTKPVVAATHKSKPYSQKKKLPGHKEIAVIEIIAATKKI